jgi:hypothetical protein
MIINSARKRTLGERAGDLGRARRHQDFTSAKA